jgi:flagellar basal-body rod protein FlgB
MSISFDNALGIHEKALSFRSQRAEVLANNIANADTPNYKARDLDFAEVLAAQKNAGAKSQASPRTHERHMPIDNVTLSAAGLNYRNVTHAALDQNSVDLQVEQAAYAENAVQFQASFTLLNNKFKGLMSALRGE